MKERLNRTMVDEHGLLWSDEDELKFKHGDMHGELFKEQVESYKELRNKGIKMGSTKPARKKR